MPSTMGAAAKVKDILIILLVLLAINHPQPAYCWNLRLFNRRNNRKSSSHVEAAPTGGAGGGESSVRPPHASGGSASSKGHGGPTRRGSATSSSSPLFADLVGDLDISSIPKWFKEEVVPRLPPFLTDTIPSKLLAVWTNLKAMILYKPPVGITAFYLTFRLFFRNRRLAQMGLSDMQIREEETFGGLGRGRKWRRRRKPLDLDLCDRDYDTYGGVEHVRGELCARALEDVEIFSAPNGGGNGAGGMGRGGAQQQDRPGVVRIGGRLRQSLSGAIVGAGSRIQRRLVPPPNESEDAATRAGRDLFSSGRESAKARTTVDATHTDDSDDRAQSTLSPSLAEAASTAMTALSVSCPPRGSRELYVINSADSLSSLSKNLAMNSKMNASSSSPEDQELLDIIKMTHSLVTVRTLDAMLRVTRDRLITSSNRLRRARANWDWAVTVYSGGPFRRAFSKAFRKIFEWFGRGSLEDDRRFLGMAEAAYRREVGRLGRVQELLLARPSELKGDALLGALGRGGVSQDAYGGGIVRPKGARDVLLEEMKGMSAEGSWSADATDWSLEARAVIRELTEEAFQTVAPDKKCLPGITVEDALDIVQQWSNGESDADVEAWHAVLVLIEGLATPRRVGEHRARVRAADLVNMAKKLDFGGVPSTVFFIWLAHIVHDTVKPHWATIVDFGKKAGVAVWGVIDMRFWRPIRDITLDLLNRRPHLLDPYALTIEENSLDNMLRDLGIGDGTPEGRAAAVAAAARMYENELNSGALRGLVRGRVVRLMLIQIQQLKAGLLKAMGSIDDLVDKNRLNVQLLASIPAFILITYGWKLLASFIVGLRMKRVTPLPMRDLQSEMTDSLRKIERCLLLSGGEEDEIHGGDGADDSSTDGEHKRTTKELAEDLDIPDAAATYKPPQLSTDELGEFVLLCHSYLLLLDYATPPVSYRTFDSVHRNMQEMLLPQGQLSVSRQLKLLALIKAKNAELLKGI